MKPTPWKTDFTIYLRLPSSSVSDVEDFLCNPRVKKKASPLQAKFLAFSQVLVRHKIFSSGFGRCIFFPEKHITCFQVTRQSEMKGDDKCTTLRH